VELTRLRELGDELRGIAGAVAAQLEGFRRVAVWADGTIEALAATVAAIEAGVELVPLNPQLGSAELRHIVADSQPEAIAGAPAMGKVLKRQLTPR
jgi:malonyl-CoA/methylmalonyl-CoA synthetase